MRPLALALPLVALAAGLRSAGQAPSGKERPRGLRVAPEVLDLFATGTAGGPFRPSIAYTLANGGTGVIEWQATPSTPWVRLSVERGTLPPGRRTRLEVSIADEQTEDLPIGLHRAAVQFENLTSGLGNTWREVRLFVRGERGLEVDAPEEIRISGPPAGPFSAPPDVLSVENAGREPIDWKVHSSERWLRLSSQGRELLPGERDSLGASVDVERAARLAPGRHRAAICLVNASDGVGTISVPVELTIRTGDRPERIAAPVREGASSVRQFGITWAFDRDYEVGRFANGDWWVVGPVLVTGITPPSRRFRGRTRNGSMLNPSPRNGTTQGYDSHAYGQYRQPGHYDAKLNVALGVSAAHPLLLRPGSSLVSTISELAADARPQVRSAAILTVLSAPAPPGSFRPPYCGTDKTIRFNESQLDYSLLAKLQPVGSTPSLASVEAMFERPWIDHVPGWIGHYVQPGGNKPTYGREIAEQVGTASLMLNLDFPDPAKRTLLVRLVQVGLDNHGVILDGGKRNWRAAAGWMSGRKWPILFAGLMLGDPVMSQIGFDASVEFGEDGQTFVVEETPPGSRVYNDGHGVTPYGPQHEGLAEWGTAHSHRPELDDSNWLGDPYRICCTATTWWGQLLAAYVMDAKPLWNHDVLFDYQDRYVRENVRRKITDGRLFRNGFHRQMWQTYRGKY